MPGPFTTVVASLTSLGGGAGNPITTIVGEGANLILPIQSMSLGEAAQSYLLGFVSTDTMIQIGRLRGFTLSEGIDVTRYSKSGDWLAQTDAAQMNRPVTVTDTMLIQNLYLPSI